MENKNNRGNGIFLGVIGVATLIVAIIGATFAYFSASTNSANNAITVNSTTVSLDFDDTVNKNLKTNLIPAVEGIATYGAISKTYLANEDEEQCIDDNGNEICSVYEFTIGNPSTTVTQDLTVSLVVQTNSFGNLKYKIYEGTTDARDGVTQLDVSDDITPVVEATEFGAANSTTKIDELSISYAPNTTHTYTMIIWIDETGGDQTNDSATDGTTGDAGRGFSAGLVITSGSGAGVTGVIGASGIEPPTNNDET